MKKFLLILSVVFASAMTLSAATDDAKPCPHCTKGTHECCKNKDSKEAKPCCAEKAAATKANTKQEVKAAKVKADVTKVSTGKEVKTDAKVKTDVKVKTDAKVKKEVKVKTDAKKVTK